MAQEIDPNEPAPRGEAAWRAERSATEQRNNAAKERARVTKTATAQAVLQRERRMEVLEVAELAELNRKIGAPRAQGS
jgi:hypothetical protein